MSLLVSLIYAQVTFSEAAEWVIWNFPVFVILLLIFIFGLELMGQIPLEHTWNFWVMPYSLVGIYERARIPEFFDHHLCYFQRGLCHSSLAGPEEGWPGAKFGEWVAISGSAWISPKGLTG